MSITVLIADCFSSPCRRLLSSVHLALSEIARALRVAIPIELGVPFWLFRTTEESPIRKAVFSTLGEQISIPEHR